MKKNSKIILINFLLLFSLSCASQNSNYLTYDEYTGIKINGISLLNINNTKGDQSAMNHLFNKNFNYESSTMPEYERTITDSDLSILFIKHSNGLGFDYELVALNVLSSSIIVELKGYSFKKGDSAVNLQSYFIKNQKSGDFLFTINPNNNSFGSYENYFLVKVNNNVITGISFFIND